MKIINKLLAIPFMVVAFNVNAANPYTDCGIGAALFPNVPVAAVTSNVIWDAGTTALISATASEDTCSNSSAETAMLIHDKYELLETDIMLESGENLFALTELMECSNNSDVTFAIKQNVASILADDDYASKTRLEKSKDLYSSMQSNEVLNSSCAVQL